MSAIPWREQWPESTFGGRHWKCGTAKALLPDLTHPGLAAKLLISMPPDMARIRTAMGDPMSRAEIDAFIPYATDLFLRGCGYRPKT